MAPIKNNVIFRPRSGNVGNYRPIKADAVANKIIEHFGNGGLSPPPPNAFAASSDDAGHTGAVVSRLYPP